MPELIYQPRLCILCGSMIEQPNSATQKMHLHCRVKKNIEIFNKKRIEKRKKDKKELDRIRALVKMRAYKADCS